MKASTSSSTQRAPLSQELSELRVSLAKLLPTLEQGSGWYASLTAQRKQSSQYSANLKSTHLSQDSSLGVVLRIYDGHTVFEQATDEVDEKSLNQLALELVERVRKTPAPAGVVKRSYTPPTWAERLKAKLESEITSQVPAHVSATTPVHFGIRVAQDPARLKPEDWLAQCQELLSRAKAAALACGLKNEDLHYLATGQSFDIEEHLFIDRETNMSQALYRLSSRVVALSGADRSYERIGGLGGLETIAFKEAELRHIFEDLKGLKSAERLEPGQYRVLCAPSITGVLAHEAFGHSQEGDTCARGRSKAWDLYQNGQIVGNEHATILNNPAIFDNGADSYAAWGSYFFDEEGWLAQEQVLLNQGRLQAPMTNLSSALRLGVPRTANGKRQDWSHGVYTRQTNTYFSAGTKTLNELMAQVPYGFLAAQCAGGMEDPKGMGIQVGMAYLKEIKNGKLTGRVFKGPAGGAIQMTGYTPDILNSIIDKSKIEYDLNAPDAARHPMNDVGGCGKYHKEFVVAGCGGPYVLLDNVILG
jgi:TldD protein